MGRVAAWMITLLIATAKRFCQLGLSARVRWRQQDESSWR